MPGGYHLRKNMLTISAASAHTPGVRGFRGTGRIYICVGANLSGARRIY